MKLRALLLSTLPAVIAGALAATPAAAAPAAQACPGNLLVNPNFDGGSRKTESLGTSLSSAVSDGWTPWFVRGTENSNREPEFKVEQVAIGGDPYRVRSGGQSMKFFTTWATHTAGFHQTVAVPPGAEVRFAIHAMIYSGEADGWNGELNTFTSDLAKYGNYHVSAGIDPTGALPAGMGAPPPASVVWGPSTMTPDQWVEVSATAVAAASRVTVYTKGAPEWGVKHNDSFWDDACFQILSRPVVAKPRPEPSRSETPVPLRKTSRRAIPR